MIRMIQELIQAITHGLAPISYHIQVIASGVGRDKKLPGNTLVTSFIPISPIAHCTYKSVLKRSNSCDSCELP